LTEIKRALTASGTFGALDERTLHKPMPASFRILVAADGSPSAQAALRTALVFPWPRGSRARGVVALRAGGAAFGPAAKAAIVRSLHASADETRAALAQRWPDADVVELHESAAEAILSEERRFRADAIALGWRGHGAFRRLLAGSVSRKVAERAAGAVLVVRATATQAPRVRRFVVGFDGSRNARQALRLLGRLEAPRRSRIVLLNVVEPLVVPTLARMPGSTRAEVKREVARVTVERLHRARTRLEAAAARLESAGWKVTPQAVVGAPLSELLIAAREHRADVLMVGARAIGGVARVLLGSVAAGALNESPVPVLIVR
jgi:nucleotide-binding universal stress UspA family protein